VQFTTPVLWTLGFMVTFVIGGVTGVLMAVPPADFVLHNSLFLVAHFHNVIIGGVVFGCLAGFTYWFPKVTGFTLDERLGRWAFWCWFIGFYVAFMPLYALGLMGMTRRMNHTDNAAWTPYLHVAVIGAVIIFAGIVFQIAQLVVSIRHRERNRDLTGDPWNGRTLEWSIPSPPPAYNFARVPLVRGLDDFWERKRRKDAPDRSPLEPIEMPTNTGAGFVIGMLTLVLGFALVWQIWWLVLAAAAAVLAVVIVHSTPIHRHFEIAVEDLQRKERLRAATLSPGA
jgi:cytochrome o ubiquinol oxidase subunit 1